jgi:hypothetical protein
MGYDLRDRRLRAAVVALLLLLAPAAGYAQTETSAPGEGPLIVELVDNPFVVATDYKVTDLDGELGQLAGGYIGRVIEDTLFVGGAGYWLVNGSGGDELAYGGLLAGWSMPLGSRIRFGVRSLVGGGRATLGTDVDFRRGAGGFNRRGPDPRGITRFGINTRGGAASTLPTTFRVRARDDFFVFEPQADLLTRVTDHMSVNWAAGYRLTALTDVLDDRLNGATGSVALQFEW